MVEQQPSKLNTRVRFPSPAPTAFSTSCGKILDFHSSAIQTHSEASRLKRQKICKCLQPRLQIVLFLDVVFDELGSVDVVVASATAPAESRAKHAISLVVLRIIGDGGLASGQRSTPIDEMHLEKVVGRYQGIRLQPV
jgi:hypothetical protein